MLSLIIASFGPLTFISSVGLAIESIVIFDNIFNFFIYLIESIQIITPTLILGLMTFVYGSLADILADLLRSGRNPTEVLLSEQSAKVSKGMESFSYRYTSYGAVSNGADSL